MTPTRSYRLRRFCRLCGQKTIMFLDLGSTPLADSFPISPHTEEEKFPLQIAFCPRCALAQLTADVDSHLLFGKNYAYYTSASPSSLNYFRQYAQDTLRRFPHQCQDFVLEIASNDGLLLKHLKTAGCHVLGIDPAANVANKAIKAGIPTLKAAFDDSLVHLLPQKASLILANNVLAHVENPASFIKGVKLALAPKGIFIFEVQYLPQLILNNQFDHIYHEHRSFFALRPLINLLRKFDLTIFDVHQYDTQGGSIRAYATHSHNIKKIEQSLSRLIHSEVKLRLNSLNTYQQFAHRVKRSKRELIRTLAKLRQQGKKIYGFGASAKGNTLLNYCQISTPLISCIIDKTRFKFNKFTPGTHIPIFSPSQLTRLGYPNYYLLLVWNYLPDVLEREIDFRKRGGHFIVPIPQPYII